MQLTPRGPFSLRAAAEFGFGPTEGRAGAFDGVMRLAFPVDGGRGYAGAVLRQAELDGPVEVELDTADGADAERALQQVARVVSLDHDGNEFLKVGERDPVIGELQRIHHGQRPVLFHSPYEAAAWAIVSARRPARQATAVREALARERGHTFTLAGQPTLAFPQADRFRDLDMFPGLNETKLQRLRGVAEAAAAGELDVPRLHELGPDRAHEEVQRLGGIGPFYASLIVVRASGFADALLRAPEPRLLRNVTELYRLEAPATLTQLAEMAEAWRPFRTWATVLIRLAGDRARR